MSAEVIAEPTIIGEARDYIELVVALRILADRRGASLMTLDALSGLQSGYCAKILTVPPIRCVGRTSLGPLLKVLGAKLVIVEDPEALAEMKSRLLPRRPKGPRRGYKRKRSTVNLTPAATS